MPARRSAYAANSRRSSDPDTSVRGRWWVGRVDRIGVARAIIVPRAVGLPDVARRVEARLEVLDPVAPVHWRRAVVVAEAFARLEGTLAVRWLDRSDGRRRGERLPI